MSARAEALAARPVSDEAAQREEASTSEETSLLLQLPEVLLVLVLSSLDAADLCNVQKARDAGDK